MILCRLESVHRSMREVGGWAWPGGPRCRRGRDVRAGTRRPVARDRNEPPPSSRGRGTRSAIAQVDLALAAAVTLGLLSASGYGQPSSSGWSGNGTYNVRSWKLPDTPGGMKPTQNWYSVAVGPDGSVYATGCDHETNSALYRVDPSDGVLRWVGDAQTAAKAANNLASGETFEKFHVAPIPMDGKVYLASMDFSLYGSGWDKTPGFHWFAYDPAANSFTDKSATDPAGVGAGKHLQAEYLAADPTNHKIWMAGIPFGNLLSYDVTANRTTNHGQPSWYSSTYAESDGCIWISPTSGKVYFSWKDVGHIWYFDQHSGQYGKRTDWTLVDKSEWPKMGQWNCARTRYYCMDNFGNIYKYDDEKVTFGRVGRISWHKSYGDVKARTFFLSPDEKYIYSVNDLHVSTNDFYLFELEIATGNTRRVADLQDLDSKITDSYILHGGHGAWDTDGNLYFVSSTWNRDSNNNAILTRVRPRTFDVGGCPGGGSTVAGRAPQAMPGHSRRPVDVRTFDIRGRELAAAAPVHRAVPTLMASEGAAVVRLGR